MIGVFLWNKIPHGNECKSIINFKVIGLTFLVTISFMIRTTSAVGWLPFIVHKAFVQRNFLKFAFAGVFIAGPLLVLMLAMDSWFYG